MEPKLGSSLEERSRDALKRAQKLMLASDFDAALAVSDDVLATAPEHAEALYTRAVCLRYLKRHDEAGDALDALWRVAPTFARGFQERGHLEKARGRREDAARAFEAAVAANPALGGSWRALGELYAASGRQADARRALDQADALLNLPKELRSVAGYLHDGQLAKAENLCRAFLQNTPHHVEAMRLLALIGARFGALDEAEFLLESALEFAPDNVQVRLDYIETLRKQQKFQHALAEAERLHAAAPTNPMFQSRYAIEKLQSGDVDGALRLFDEVLERLPDDPATLTSRGHALKTRGRADDAIASYRRAYRAKPGHGDAYFSLANLKTYRFTDDELAAMEAQAAAPTLPYQDRVQFHFALGKALEDRGDVARAFDHYEAGNGLKRAASRYDADKMSAEIDAQIEHCTADLFERLGGAGCEAVDPIFIVGLPRAGSTLLEQILASHSQVDGTLELPNVLSTAQRLRGRRRQAGGGAYPANLKTLDADEFQRLGAQYIEETRVHRAGAPRFTDKMPNNFRHIGLIRLMLPNAKIIDARREPMASCFSGFKQLFAEGQEFTYGLREIGQYYRDYVRLMRHWDAASPGAVLRVQHEDVIANLEGEVRRLLDFCGLPFEPQCLDFHKTDRSVRTASSEQVRQPINAAGVDKWRPFEPYLGPLRDALGPALTEYRS
ncbi:MAG: sulfotransferase [Parvularculaceae bacterium]